MTEHDGHTIDIGPVDTFESLRAERDAALAEAQRLTKELEQRKAGVAAIAWFMDSEGGMTDPALRLLSFDAEDCADLVAMFRTALDVEVAARG